MIWFFQMRWMNETRRTRKQMKLRHAAALALVGWCLILPPIVYPPQSNGPTHVEQNAPLSQWRVWRRFDSQKDCEEALQLGFKKPAELRATRPPPAVGTGVWTGYADAQAEAARCVKDDDPRLKAN